MGGAATSSSGRPGSIFPRRAPRPPGNAANPTGGVHPFTVVPLDRPDDPDHPAAMTATSAPPPDVMRTQRRRAIVASTVGTTVEWYDFFLYGTAAALIFP